MRHVSEVLVGKPEEKKTVLRAGCRWEDGIRV
jgi:hypothetical protein